MTRSIEKRLRSLVAEWGKMLDERTEMFNLIIPKSIEEEIDKLVTEVKQHSEEASRKAKLVSERLSEEGKVIGRPKIKTPTASELRKELLRGKSMQVLAKELKVSRATIRQRLANGD